MRLSKKILKFRERFCIDCNIKLSKNAWFYKYLRCGSCAQRLVANSKPKNPKPRCQDCGAQVTRKKYKRCHSCAAKYFLNFPRMRLILSKNTTGKSNPNWQGGLTSQGYPWYFNESLKEFIRKRDDYECQNCHMTEEENIIIRGRVLDVHHIDYNKDNCLESNLITLCNQCNVRANYNRDYWQVYFKEKLDAVILN